MNVQLRDTQISYSNCFFIFYLNIRIIYQVANSDKFEELSWEQANCGITRGRNCGIICGAFTSCFKLARKSNFEDTSPLIDPRRSTESEKLVDIDNGIDGCGNDNDKLTNTVIDLLDDDDDDDDDEVEVEEEEEEEEEKQPRSSGNEEGEDIVIHRAGGENFIDLLEEDDDDYDEDIDVNNNDQSIVHQPIKCSRNKRVPQGNTDEDRNARINQNKGINIDGRIMVDIDEESIIDLLEDDDGDDDVVVLEQEQAAEFQIEMDNEGKEDDDDCDDAVITGSTGKNANSDYPHSRGDCVTNPFEKDPKIYCPNVSQAGFCFDTYFFLLYNVN
jgi:hypothetical protein